MNDPPVLVIITYKASVSNKKVFPRYFSESCFQPFENISKNKNEIHQTFAKIQIKS